MRSILLAALLLALGATASDARHRGHFRFRYWGLACGSGRSTSFNPAVRAARSVITIAFMIGFSSGGSGVDVILDMIGGSYAERNQQALAVEGRLVQIGIMEGSKITLDLLQMMVRRQTITGSTLRARRDCGLKCRNRLFELPF